MNTQNTKPAIEVKATVTPVQPTPVATPTAPVPAVAQTPAKADGQAPAPVAPVAPVASVAVVPAAPMQLAKVGGEDIIIPPEVGEVMKHVGANGTRALMTAKDWLLLKSGFTIISGKGKKLSAVKDQVGKDKAKLLLAEFNRKKVAYHIWSRRVMALAASESSMKHATRVSMGKGGVVNGFDTKSRFVAQSDTTLVSENEDLRKQLAAANLRLAALPAPAAS